MQTLLFLDIGGGELIIILLAVFVLFGPSKLPEISKKLGKAMSDLKDATNDIKDEFNKSKAEIEQEIENQINQENEDIQNHELKG